MVSYTCEWSFSQLKQVVPQGPTPAGLGFIGASKPCSDDALLVETDVIDETDDNSTARHDSVKLSNAIAEAYRKYRSRRRLLPRVRLILDLRRPKNRREYLDGADQADPAPSYNKVNGK